jgi:uncharacterized protein YecE (DUF72 family)
VHTDSDKFPAIADPQSNLAYIRLMRSNADCATGYPPAMLDRWATGARTWVKSPRREALIFFINGAKERAPAAALELIRRVS